MRFVTRPKTTGPVDLSIVLLDWSCRESFHLLDCLARQTVDRSRYEILWIEFYDRPNPQLAARIDDAARTGRPPPVDTYCLLEMDRGACFHKHLMLNAGLCLARGDVVCFADSDAIARPTFVASVLDKFAGGEEIVLHLDEVRNNHPSFHPFRSPAIEDVTGFGCINWVNGRPAGLLDRADPLHSRNYGACMAARREDLIAVGGSDMHGDYLGHIAGVNEMTWRLVNAGKREVWHGEEWLHHVWHPGQAGDENYAGPHDGMQISLRALRCLHSDRVLPFVENPAIRLLRGGAAGDDPGVLDALIDPLWPEDWRYTRLPGARRAYVLGDRAIRLREHRDDSEEVRGLDARRKPLFGRPLTRGMRLRLIPLALGLLARQLAVKRRAARWSRPRARRGALREWTRKLRALGSFLGRILAFDRHWFRQCWLVLAYAAQERKTDLVLYGRGDAVRILRALAHGLPVRIRAICPPGPGPTHRPDCPTLSESDLAATDATIVVAALVDTPRHVARLEQLGIGRDRILTVQ